MPEAELVDCITLFLDRVIFLRWHRDGVFCEKNKAKSGDPCSGGAACGGVFRVCLPMSLPAAVWSRLPLLRTASGVSGGGAAGFCRGVWLLPALVAVCAFFCLSCCFVFFAPQTEYECARPCGYPFGDRRRVRCVADPLVALNAFRWNEQNTVFGHAQLLRN